MDLVNSRSGEAGQRLAMGAPTKPVLDRDAPRSLGVFHRLAEMVGDAFVVAVVSPFVALASDTVSKIFLAMIVLDIPLELGTHFFFREQDDAWGALGGLSVSITTIGITGLFLARFVRALTCRKAEPHAPLHINPALAAYLAAAMLSVFVAQDTELSLFELALLVETFLVYTYVANFIRTRQEILFVLRMLLIGGLLESAIMIVLRFTGMPAHIWGLPSNIHWIHVETDPITHATRVGGTVGSANTAGAYLGILLTCAATVFFTKLGRVYRLLALAVLGTGGVALIFTLSRGAWIAFAISLAILCLVGLRRQGHFSKAPLVIAAVVALLCVPFQSYISGRLFGDDRGSAESRMPLNELALRMTADHPVLGVGVNNFTVAMDPYLTAEFRKGFLFAVHNKYLLVLSETGMLGLVTYLAFLISTLRTGWRAWRLRDPLVSPLALGFAAALAGHMVQMSVEVFRGRPIQQSVWLLAGLLTAICKMDLRQFSKIELPDQLR